MTRAPVAALLLAAGAGRRLGGRPKALLPYAGRPLVEHAAAVLEAGGCARVHVVLGADAARVRERADLSGRVVVENPDWATGMGSSLRTGLDSVAATGAGAALVALVDMPGVTPEAVARVVAAYRAGADLVAATYHGRRGHPVLFAAAHWPRVREAARGDAGARAVLAAGDVAVTAVECGDVAAAYDIDTPADLWRLTGG